MFLASGRAGGVRMLVLRKPNILCTEFLDVAGAESWCGERERCTSLLRLRMTSWMRQTELAEEALLNTVL